MRTINLFVALVLSIASIGIAACTGSDADLSGSALGGVDAVQEGDVDPLAGGDTGAGDDIGAGLGGIKVGGAAEPVYHEETNGLLSRVAAGIDGPTNLDTLIQMVEGMAADPGVGEPLSRDLSDYILSLADNGDAVAQDLVGGSQVSADELGVLLGAYIEGFGGASKGKHSDDVETSVEEEAADLQTVSEVLNAVAAEIDAGDLVGMDWIRDAIGSESETPELANRSILALVNHLQVLGTDIADALLRGNSVSGAAASKILDGLAASLPD